MTARRTAEPTLNRVEAFGVRRSGRAQWGMLAFVVLALGAIVAVLLLLAQGSGGSDVPYSVRSSGPEGLMGLRLWLEDMGYKVEVGFGPDTADADTIFLFPDAEALDANQLRGLATRVEAGRTLVLADAESLDAQRTFGALVQQSQPIVDQVLHQTQPLLPASAAPSDKPVTGRSLGKMPGSDLLSVLQTEDGKAAVLLEQRGKGTVWHVGIQGAFTNEELGTGWSRALAVAVLRGKPSGSAVYIVNGETEGQGGAPVSARTGPDGLWAWTLRHPVGWAALLLTALVLFYLFTQGRRLGPPLIVADPHRRRAAVEHIEAMASLAERAGHRDGIARYQKARLKRRLGQAWRVSADLDDTAFAASLTQQARLPSEKTAELASLLAQFDSVTDASVLVGLVDTAGRFTLE